MKRKIEWTEEDNEAVRAYKEDLKSGKVIAIPLDEAMKLIREKKK